MSYKLTIIQRPAYLHIIVTGLNSRENVMNYLYEVRRECSSRGVFRVLIEERLEGARLETWDVFLIADEGSRLAWGVFEAIAYVDVNAKGDLMDYAEAVAFNRSLPVKFFSSVKDAEKWLSGEDPSSIADLRPHPD